MGSDKIETSPSSLKPAIDELIKGRELANQLSVLLHGDAQIDVEPNPVTMDLTRVLVGAFSNAIAALDAGEKPAERDARANPGGKRKIRSSQRGCYRRRSNPYSCAMIKEARTLEDGHSWRKYGQKEIFNAKFARSYYRCAHKFDQGCTATRQVQRSEADPSWFVITYFGEHTCRDPAEALSCCLEGDSCMIDFASGAKAAAGFGRRMPEHPPLRQECLGGETVSNHPTPGSSSSELCFELPELAIRDHGDVTSELQPPVDALGWDFMEQSIEFSDLLGLEMMYF